MLLRSELVDVLLFLPVVMLLLQEELKNLVSTEHARIDAENEASADTASTNAENKASTDTAADKDPGEFCYFSAFLTSKHSLSPLY